MLHSTVSSKEISVRNKGVNTMVSEGQEVLRACQGRDSPAACGRYHSGVGNFPVACGDDHAGADILHPHCSAQRTPC